MGGESDRARWDHIGRDVLAVHQDFQNRALGDLQRRGHTSLTASLIALLPHLETGGSRVAEAARRAGITKQAVGKLVGELERLGYVTRSPDPTDGRAAVVTFTTTGKRLLSDIRRTIATIEKDYAARLGEERLRQLRVLLNQLVPHDVPPAPP